MKYKVVMSDYIQDQTIEKEIEAKSVFDAIDDVSKMIEHPEETYLVEAYPLIEKGDSNE